MYHSACYLSSSAYPWLKVNSKNQHVHWKENPLNDTLLSKLSLSTRYRPIGRLRVCLKTHLFNRSYLNDIRDIAMFSKHNISGYRIHWWPSVMGRDFNLFFYSYSHATLRSWKFYENKKIHSDGANAPKMNSLIFIKFSTSQRFFEVTVDHCLGQHRSQLT